MRRAAVLILLLAAPALAAQEAGQEAEPIPVSAGPALLGADDPVLFGLPGPRPYEIGAFAIDAHEVTNAAYGAFVAATGHPPPEFADDGALNAPDQPVTGVTWDDAAAYCAWAGGRLPTETEWEKAARGTAGQLYAWGDEYDPDAAHLSGDLPLPVASYPRDKSPYGAFDMGGNVSEWVADTRIARAGICGIAAMDAGAVSDGGVSLAEIAALFGEANLCLAPEIAPDLYAPEPCAFIKGSSFDGRPHMTPASNRLWDYTNAYAEFVGFRCAYDR